jgi:hypothetical protein
MHIYSNYRVVKNQKISGNDKIGKEELMNL